MSPIQVACLLVLSVVPACYAQTVRTNACPSSATPALLECLNPLGSATTKIALQILSEDIPGMIITICEANLPISTSNSMMVCLKTPLALCNQTDPTVQLLQGASGADIQDVCMYRTQCSPIVEDMKELGVCLAPLRTITATTACTVANTACGCIEGLANVCAAASNAQLFSSRVVIAYDASQQYSCSDSAVPACVSALPVTMSTTAGSTAVGPAILPFVAMALFRFF